MDLIIWRVKNRVALFSLFLRMWEGGRGGLLFFTMYMCVDVCYESVLLLLASFVLCVGGLQRRMRVETKRREREEG